MFNKNQTALKAQLDRAMSILSLQNPTYAANLMLKYFPPSRNKKPSFSAAEKAFIAGHPVIRVAVLKDDAPFSEQQRDGSITGILPEYYSHLGKVVGSKFQCVPVVSKSDACAALARGEADLVGKFENDVFDASSHKVILTVPFLKTNIVQITRAGTDKLSSCAVPECNSRLVSSALAQSDSPLKIKLLANSKECFGALKSGRVDSVICTMPAAAWLLNRNRASEYVVSAFDCDDFAICCAPAFGADGNTLRSILDKVLAVDGGFIHKLITSDTLKDSADLAGYFDSLPISLVAAFAIVAALLLILAVMALAVLVRRRAAEKKLAAQQAELAVAAEANKARHSFFGSVSHDMRTPLNGIIGFTELAMASEDPARIRDCLSKIRLSSSILNSLVNDMLVMTRLESGKYILKPQPCDTRELFAGVLEPIRELAKKKGVTFADNMSSIRRRTVMADPLSLQKIFLNLLSNAVKFTPAGGTVTLHCRLEPADAEEPDSVLSVSDTGRGISPEFLPRVFEPFAQENAVNADTSGTGIGLSIVKSIVDAMGGKIKVESEQGRGAVFTVRLHLKEVKEQPQQPAAAETPDVSLLKGKRALVCEDNELNLEIIKSVLSDCGMEVCGAVNGKLGVEEFGRSSAGYFDVILLDLRMPVMDGMTAARAIRALGRPDAASVPIFAVSADAYPENVRDCLAAGMNAHIAKPINVGELVAALAKFIKK
jgi:signal transduction histidine kinase